MISRGFLIVCSDAVWRVAICDFLAEKQIVHFIFVVVKIDAVKLKNEIPRCARWSIVPFFVMSTVVFQAHTFCERCLDAPNTTSGMRGPLSNPTN